MADGDGPRRPVLLLDNYDSYTYNLAQLIGQISGALPLTVRNDQFGSWAELAAALPQPVGAVVISPGPGDPTKASDFGVCADAIRESGLPLLGVCLGHQGLAAAFGGAVVRAPQVMHGRISSVCHDGAGIFCGIPSPFSVVRYHSLVVERTSMPPCLHVQASADDGCVMAIAHATRPLFGVQFHPESICTEHGERLMRNFLMLAAQFSPAPGYSPSVPLQTSPSSFTASDALASQNGRLRAQIGSLGRRLLVHSMRVEREGGCAAATPEVFSRLYGNSAMSFWLDSSNRQDVAHPLEAAQGVHRSDARSHFSYMGCVEGDGSWLLRCARDGRVYRTCGSSGEVELNGVELLTEMRRSLHEWRDAHAEPWPGREGDMAHEVEILPARCAFRCGYVGFLAYEAWHHMGPAATAAELQPVRARVERAGGREREVGGFGDAPTEGGLDAAAFLFVDRLLAFDHDGAKVHLLCLCDTSSVVSAQEWLRSTATLLAPFLCSTAARANSERECSLHSPTPSLPLPVKPRCIAREVATARSSSDEPSARPSTRFTCERGKAQYARDIGAIHEHLRAGDSYEICITTGFRCQASPSPLQLYHTLRAINPAPYSAFLRLDPARMRRFEAPSRRACGVALDVHAAAGAPGATAPQIAEFGPGGCAVCCSSPERFLRVSVEGIIESKPIKGTARRDENPSLDAMGAQALLSSEKDRAENLMITDLIRNDLGRVCAKGTVHVPSLMAVETYATVHQLVSTIRGRLETGMDALDATAAAFPPGSMTGAPKIRTMRLIDELEQAVPRGIYSGSLGFFSVDGAADLNVVIRTAIVTSSEVRVSAGGAGRRKYLKVNSHDLRTYAVFCMTSLNTNHASKLVVAMSEANDEWNEVLLKARAPMRAVSICLNDDPEAYTIAE